MTTRRARARRRPSLLLSVAGLVAAIVAGLVFLRPPPPVTIVIVNASGKPIQWAEVVHTHRASRIEGIQPIGPIAVGETKTVQYPSRGESQFKLTVHFADGSEVRGGAGRAKPGYRFTETVLASKIGSELHVPEH